MSFLREWPVEKSDVQNIFLPIWFKVMNNVLWKRRMIKYDTAVEHLSY